MKTVFAVGALVAVIVLGFAWDWYMPDFGVPSAEEILDTSKLPGIQEGKEPWHAESSRLLDRLHIIDLAALSTQSIVYRAEQHLDIYIEGRTVPIPEGIGRGTDGSFVAPLQTRDESGIIHIESDRSRDFTLGNFFDVWGVRFTAECIGGYCVTKENPLFVYVNGKAHPGDPRELILVPHQEIAILYGPAELAPPIPRAYKF